jgi:hypothetical protein
VVWGRVRVKGIVTIVISICNPGMDPLNVLLFNEHRPHSLIPSTPIQVVVSLYLNEQVPLVAISPPVTMAHISS